MRPLEPRPPRNTLDEAAIKPDWKDFIALVVAAYSLLLPPLLLILGTGALVVLLLSGLLR
ncbi:MAG: hypothetical protein K6T57_03925 [Thermaceae bacterium]|nr:hypothetical protein [Thermaceae bacterium]